MDNTFGLLYRISTFGESHGGAVCRHDGAQRTPDFIEKIQVQPSADARDKVIFDPRGS